MLPAVLALAILAAPDATAIIEADLPRTWAGRGQYARELVTAAYHEGRRRGLDPMALLAVSYVESGWQPWATRAQDASHGPYQLIAGHPGPVEARGLLAGCGGQGTCEAPEIVYRRARVARGRTMARTGAAPWTRAELQDPVISTYLAAYEIQRHLAVAYRRRLKYTRIPRGCPKWLVPWGHYNSGWHLPRWYYLERLCKAHKRLTGRNY
jgi:hypothetical protein